MEKILKYCDCCGKELSRTTKLNTYLDFGPVSVNGTNVFKDVCKECYCDICHMLNDYSNKLTHGVIHPGCKIAFEDDKFNTKLKDDESNSPKVENKINADKIDTSLSSSKHDGYTVLITSV